MKNGGDQNGNTGYPPMASKFVQYHRYIEFYTQRNCQKPRMYKAEVSLTQYTRGNTRPFRASACKRLAGALYIDQKQMTDQ